MNICEMGIQFFIQFFCLHNGSLILFRLFHVYYVGHRSLITEVDHFCWFAGQIHDEVQT